MNGADRGRDYGWIQGSGNDDAGGGTCSQKTSLRQPARVDADHAGGHDEHGVPNSVEMASRYLSFRTASKVLGGAVIIVACSTLCSAPTEAEALTGIVYSNEIGNARAEDGMFTRSDCAAPVTVGWLAP